MLRCSHSFLSRAAPCLQEQQQNSSTFLLPTHTAVLSFFPPRIRAKTRAELLHGQAGLVKFLQSRPSSSILQALEGSDASIWDEEPYEQH